MSFFPTAYLTSPSTSNSSFSPLFRFLDDFEQHQSSSSPHHHRSAPLRTFTPKFDVKELADAYELHGDLPGIEQKDVDIEFTDASTLIVKGRTEKSYTRGTPPAGFITESSSEKPAAIEEGNKNGEHHVTPHKATVEDENENNDTTVANTGKKEEKKEEKKPEAKYWISERSVGEFSRTFTFPGRVDQEGVKASMKNGVLSIVVPKMRKQEGRKITIQ